MYYKSKKISLIILVATALVCSRIMFALFNDPEGPNLLIITVMAVILFFISWAAYVYALSTTGFKRLLLAIATQVIVAGVCFLLGN